MVVRFVCKCGKSLKAPDEYIGKKVSCSKCGEISKVPEKDKTSESKKKSKPASKSLHTQEHVLPSLAEVRSREEVMADKTSTAPETPDDAAASSNIANKLLRKSDSQEDNDAGAGSPYSKKKPAKEKPKQDDSKWAEEKRYLKEYTKYYGKMILPGAVAVIVVCFGLYSLMTAMVNTVDHPTLGTVTGIVTLDDKPLPRAEVTFIPQDEWKEDKLPAHSVGITNEQGEFELTYSKDLKGAAIGNHFVRIISYEKRVPVIYNINSVLKYEVKDASNKADFTLVSK